MSVISEKFLPASLSEILDSLEKLHNSINECITSIENFDASEFSEKVEKLTSEVDSVKDSFDKVEERLNNIESSNTDITELEDRVGTLEALTEQFFDA